MCFPLQKWMGMANELPLLIFILAILRGSREKLDKVMNQLFTSYINISEVSHFFARLPPLHSLCIGTELWVALAFWNAMNVLCCWGSKYIEFDLPRLTFERTHELKLADWLEGNTHGNALSIIPSIWWFKDCNVLLISGRNYCVCCVYMAEILDRIRSELKRVVLLAPRTNSKISIEITLCARIIRLKSFCLDFRIPFDDSIWF